MSEGDKQIVSLPLKRVHQISLGKSYSKSIFRERWLEGTLRKTFEDANLIKVVQKMPQ